MINSQIIEPGISFNVTEKVTPENTAKRYGSGLIDVYATPAMIALMENAAMQAVMPFLLEEQNTVGIEICVRHTKATSIGMEVTAEATLKEIDGKRLIFDVFA